eukprot:350895-Chlamydomonas_euryale.AAC.2
MRATCRGDERLVIGQLAQYPAGCQWRPRAASAVASAATTIAAAAAAAAIGAVEGLRGAELGLKHL